MNPIFVHVRYRNASAVALILASTFLPACLAQAPQTDILGVTLNMTLEQARAKIGSDLRPVLNQGSDPAIKYFVAWKPDEAWAIETIDNRVVYAQHEQEWKNPNMMPLRAATFAKLEEKYGRNPNHDWVRWGFDRAGQPVDQATLGRCDQQIVNASTTYAQAAAFFPQYTFGIASSAVSSLSFPSMFAPNCPIFVVNTGMSIDTSHSDVAVSSLKISLRDVDALYKETARYNAVVRAQKNAADQKRNASRQTAPF